MEQVNNGHVDVDELPRDCMVEVLATSGQRIGRRLGGFWRESHNSFVEDLRLIVSHGIYLAYLMIAALEQSEQYCLPSRQLDL